MNDKSGLMIFGGFVVLFYAPKKSFCLFYKEQMYQAEKLQFTSMLIKAAVTVILEYIILFD